MHRISDKNHEEIIAYNLRDGGTAVTIFADAQAYRVEKARWFISAMLPHIPAPAKIVELGCSAGDIGGFFSKESDVIGVDVVPAAVSLSRERYPHMVTIEAVAESVEPVACDILVLTEFLEHITDPVDLISRWLPLARYALIGHPLNDTGIEPGHIWSYTLDDYFEWHRLGGHQSIETHLFQGPFPEMVMGISGR